MNENHINCLSQNTKLFKKHKKLKVNSSG